LDQVHSAVHRLSHPEDQGLGVTYSTVCDQAEAWLR